MKSTGIVRQIDELGRIVIPKEMRDSMNIVKFDPIEIYADGDKIILSKHENSCVICRSQADLTIFKDKKICQACLDEIKKNG